jgi:hypothetical protein
MWFHSLLASWKSARPRRTPPARRGTRLTLERLEDRTLLSNYSAASVSALIADINAANTAGGSNTIQLSAATTAPYVLTATNNTTNSANGLPVIAANDNLTIVGNGDTIERSTASGTAGFRLFDVSGGSLTLENLTLQGGLATSQISYQGGAIYNNQGALTLSGVTVQDNIAASAGGGIYSYYGSVTLEGGTIVQKNTAEGSYGGLNYAGSAGYGGGLYSLGGTVTMTNATLDNNNAQLGIGGGLYASGCTVTMTNATLDKNSASGEGGGLCLNFTGYGAGSATLTNCTLQGNSAGHGGGLYVDHDNTLTLANDTVESNSTGLGGSGGGLYVAGGTVTLTSDTVEFNKALGYGGGLYVAGGTVTLTSDTVESNQAYNGYGYGGGLYVAGGTVTLTSDTVESNQASNAYGGGLFIGSRATVYLDSFTVANTINNTDKSGLNGPTANIDGTYILQNP